MTIENQSSIRFSVDESVWFKKGQEVSEVLSMSLDPEIMIQEHENYVSIRGALQLTGEYYPDENEGAEIETIDSLREGASVRTVDEVRESDSGVNELIHRFPVDITIPMNRIENLEDVYVVIESFDYEIPESGRLQLSADLSISGIKGEQQEEVQEPVKEQRAETVTPFKSAEPEDNVTALFEDTEKQEEEDEIDEFANDPFPSFESEARKEPVAVEEDVEDENEVEMTEQETKEEIAGAESEDEVEEEKAEPTPRSPQIEMKSRPESYDNTWSPKSEYREEQEEEPEVEEVVNEQQEEEQPKKVSKRDENALYLTKIFADGQREAFSKVRMRIIQNGETLETIADSYDVSTSQLLRINQLEDDHISEGEIIYLPARAGREE